MASNPIETCRDRHVWAKDVHIPALAQAYVYVEDIWDNGREIRSGGAIIPRLIGAQYKKLKVATFDMHMVELTRIRSPTSRKETYEAFGN